MPSEIPYRERDTVFNYVARGVIFSDDNDVNDLRRANKLRHQKNLLRFAYRAITFYAFESASCFSTVTVPALLSSSLFSAPLL